MRDFLNANGMAGNAPLEGIPSIHTRQLDPKLYVPRFSSPESRAAERASDPPLGRALTPEELKGNFRVRITLYSLWPQEHIFSRDDFAKIALQNINSEPVTIGMTKYRAIPMTDSQKERYVDALLQRGAANGAIVPSTKQRIELKNPCDNNLLDQILAVK